MGWVIDTDLLSGGQYRLGAVDDPETAQRFRLLDDDGEVYYLGAIDVADLDDESTAFAPLTWAANDSGCTALQLATSAGGWETL